MQTSQLFEFGNNVVPCVQSQVIISTRVKSVISGETRLPEEKKKDGCCRLKLDDEEVLGASYAVPVIIQSMY